MPESPEAKRAKDERPLGTTADERTSDELDADRLEGRVLPAETAEEKNDAAKTHQDYLRRIGAPAQEVDEDL